VPLRLSPGTLAGLPGGVARPGYDRQAQRVGIIHLGIGAFHRAHQAWYADRAMAAGDRDWAILGVSLRSAEASGRLVPQDGLYTLAERSAVGATLAVIGAVKGVLVATREPEAVTAAIAAADTHVVTLTITEKGYCRGPDGALDRALAGPGSVYGVLARGLRARRDAGLPGVTLLSCDNLAAAGRQLARLLGQHLEAHDPELGWWVAAMCACPSAMVDRIVPATTEDDRGAVAEALGGVRDEATVITEPFSQWVIEDRFAGPRPRWERVGAQLVADVAPYETAKLRLLNGAHSALAYLGLARGHAFVHEAVGDPAVRPLVERLMRLEAAPTVKTAPGQDLGAYADALLARFANPALRHRLIQIAADGSQKLPQRWLDTLAVQAARGAACPAILTALAAWLRHVRGDDAPRWGPVVDPLAGPLAAAWRAHGREGVLPALFGPGGVVSGVWTPTGADRAAIESLL
jgi:fructuronate reductase